MKIQETEGQWVTCREYYGMWLNCGPVGTDQGSPVGYAVASIEDEKDVRLLPNDTEVEIAYPWEGNKTQI